MNEKRTTSDGLIVNAYSIIGTNVICFDVYEPYNGHSTFTHIDGVKMGDILTAPKKCQSLPAYSQERLKMFMIERTEAEQRAKIAIMETFGDDYTLTYRDGRAYSEL